MRKKLVTLQIIQTIFIIILFLVAILEKNGIMQREKSFMVFYVLSCLIYWIILNVITCIIMHKNNRKEKKIFLLLVLLSIEILLLGIFCGSVDNRVDMLEFTKHCKETTATVYNIDKSLTSYLSGDDTWRAELTYIYDVEYFVDESRYSAYFSDESYSSSDDDCISAESKVESMHKPKHKIGDAFTIYYNTENPEDWRRDIGYLSDKGLNIFAFIIIGLRVFVLGKAIMDYNKEKKEEKNLV